MSRTARDIATQYSNDCSELLVYFMYLRRQVAITDAAMTRLNAGLVKHGFEPIEEKKPNPHGNIVPYSADEAATLLPHLNDKGKELWKQQSALTGENVRRMRDQSASNWSEEAERAIKFALTRFPCNLPSESQLHEVRSAVEKHLLDNQIQDVDKPIDLDLVMSIARHRKRYNEVVLLQQLEGEVGTLRWAAVSHHPEQQTNVFRQSFILLMTHFDAAVFDLVRLALKNNFFVLAPKFGATEKLTYGKFVGHKDFDSLRDALVDDLLRSRYVKDLIFELRDLGVAFRDDHNDGGFPRLFELIQRRNINLHNRGIVDSRYLELNKDGKPIDSCGSNAPDHSLSWSRGFSTKDCRISGCRLR